MNKQMAEKIEILSEINESFYALIENLKKENFDFCAFVVQGAYELYMAEVEKRLKEKDVN